ncbi:MAG: hypothetical protein JNL03_01345 [Prolixibacteraceae bacterium]|nr:hypothetical protein [Prolixibacteraceae bacterium]
MDKTKNPMTSDKITTEMPTKFPDDCNDLGDSSLMEKEELNEKLMEYINRNNFWTDKTINQLGYSINLFTTVGIGFLGYLVTNRDKFPPLEFISGGDINCLLITYFTATFLIFFSIIIGFASVLSRLFDFRITRHISLTRKRFLSRTKSRKGLINSPIIDISKEKYCRSFWKNVFGKIEFIDESDFKNNKVPDKIEQLRKESKILGALTWEMHRCQIALFIIGTFLYGLTIFR